MYKYKKVKTIGKGSFGYAVLVRNIEEPSNLFVMKMIDIQKMSSKQQEEALNEIEVLKRLDNPFIIRYKESFVEKKVLCIVMDFADGGDLYNLINEYKKTKAYMPEPLVRKIFTQLALGLLHVHTNKILHRDLKTQNIFLTKQRNVKLGDFGISRVLQHTYDVAKTAIGTPYYLSPEICQEKSYNHKSDVWSIGCILYEMLSLNHAFDGASMKQLILRILEGTYPSPPPHYSSEIKELLAMLLKTNPDERPGIYDILQMPVIKEEIKSLEREFGRFKELITANKLSRNKSSEKLRPGQLLIKDKRSKSFVDINDVNNSKRSMKKFEILKKGEIKNPEQETGVNNDPQRKAVEEKVKIIQDINKDVERERNDGSKNDRNRIYYNFNRPKTPNKEINKDDNYNSGSTNAFISNDKFNSNNRSLVTKIQDDENKAKVSQGRESTDVNKNTQVNELLKADNDRMQTIAEEKVVNRSSRDNNGPSITDSIRNNNRLLLRKFNLKSKTPDSNPIIQNKSFNNADINSNRSFMLKKNEPKPINTDKETANGNNVFLPSQKLVCNFPNNKNTDKYEPLDIESPQVKQTRLFNYESTKNVKEHSVDNKRVYSSLNIKEMPSSLSIVKQSDDKLIPMNKPTNLKVDIYAKAPQSKDRFADLQDQPLKSNFLFECLPYKLDDKDTITYKVEALKIYLEKELTLVRLLFVYNGLRDSKSLGSLSAVEEKFLPFINQLVFLEDRIYLNNNN